MKYVLLIMMLLSLSAHARIGETLGECVKRYSDSDKAPKFRTAGAVKKYVFSKGDIRTEVWIVSGKCMKLYIWHKGRIVPSNTLKFLTPYVKAGGAFKTTAKVQWNNRLVDVRLTSSYLILEHKSLRKMLKAAAEKNDPLKGF